MLKESRKLVCPDCCSSLVWKDGVRYAKDGEVQRYVCRSCGRRFSESTTASKVEFNVARQVFKEPYPRKDLPKTDVLRGDLPIQPCVQDLPFQFGKDVGSHHSSGVTIVGKPLNGFRDYNRDRLVCASGAEAKNLVKVESRIEKRAAGATKPTKADVKGKIIEHLWWLKKEAYAESTIKQRIYMLKTLGKLGADLLNPESVKETVAKQQNWSEGYKLIAVTAYALFAEMLDIEFHPPRYRTQQKLPFIPLESEIDQLIAGCGKKTSTFLQTLKETGMRPGEAKRLKWTDVDTFNNTITVN